MISSAIIVWARRHLRVIVVVLCAIALLAVIAIGGVSYCYGRTWIRVHNSTQEQLRDVRILVRGGSVDMGDVYPSSNRRGSFVARHDSDVVVEYHDSNGVTRSVVIDVYVYRGSTGTLDVWIGADGEVRFKHNHWL
jgi:hypothetical protein